MSIRLLLPTVERESAVARVVLVTTSLVLTLGYVPGVGVPGWSVRVAALLPLLLVGMLVLVFSARTDLPSALALAFVGASAISAWASDAPLASLLGPPSWFTGVVAAAAASALWAIARLLDQRGAEAVSTALILGATLNGVAALFQTIGILPVNIPDSSQFGRSSGLMGNPVHLSAITAAGLALCCRRYASRPGWVYGLAISSLAMGVNLAGGRAGVATAVVGTALALRSARGQEVATALCYLAVGLAVSIAVAEPGQSGSDRATNLSANGRTGAWEAGISGALDRPVLGWGPGRFEAAATPRRSLESRRVEIAEFVDAHNWPIEYLVTTGVLGLGLLLAWVVASSVAARGGLAQFALVIGLNGLLQPSFVGVTATGCLALGAACPRRNVRFPRRHRRVLVASAAIGLVVGGAFLSSEVHRARIDGTPRGLRSFQMSRSLFPPTPMLIGAGADAHLAAGDAGEAEKLARRAIELEPGVVVSTLRLANILERRGENQLARAEYQKALVLDPWSVPALRGLAATTRQADPQVSQWACGRIALIRPKALCNLDAGAGLEPRDPRGR